MFLKKAAYVSEKTQAAFSVNILCMTMPYLQMVEIKILSKPLFHQDARYNLQIVEIKILSKPRFVNDNGLQIYKQQKLKYSLNLDYVGYKFYHLQIVEIKILSKPYIKEASDSYLQIVEIKILSKPHYGYIHGGIYKQQKLKYSLNKFTFILYIIIYKQQKLKYSLNRKCDKDKQKYLLLDSYLVIKKTYLPRPLYLYL